MSKQIKELLKDIVIALAIALVLIQFVRPTVVKQSSMEPTLHENDYIIMAKQAYLFSEPERGDIIVFKSHLEDEERGGDKLLVKRIIGLPGDHITLIDNTVYINDKKLDEPYVKDPGDDPGEISQDIPEGKLFVMGDNRGVSLDSRSEEVGLVDIDDIVGKAFFRLFPFNSIGRV